MLSGKRSWMRRAINRTCGRWSRMSRSRSVSLTTSDTAFEYIRFLCRRCVYGCGIRGKHQLQKTALASSLQVFRNPLPGGKKRQRLPGSGGFAEKRAERAGLIESGKEQALRLKDFEG